MQKKSLKRTLSLLVCSALIAAAALCTGCSGQSTAPSDTSPVSEAATSEAAPAATEAPATADTAAAAQVLGKGATAFTFTVVDGDGNETDLRDPHRRPDGGRRPDRTGPDRGRGQ